MDVTKQNRDYKSLQPLAQKAYSLFIAECDKQGVNIFPTEFLRPQERQWYLACQGRTVAQAKSMGVPSSYADKYANPKEKQVTWTLKSNHATGYAWDMACKPPQNLYDESVLKKAQKIAESIGLSHGGSYGDSPHFECPKNWSEPKMQEEAKQPQWKLDAIKSVCDKYGLDTKLWLSKCGDEVTVGDLFGILNKVLK